MSKNNIFKVDLLSKKESPVIEALANFTCSKQFNASNQDYIYPRTLSSNVWNRLIAPTNKNHPDLYFHLPRMISPSKSKKINQNSNNLLWTHLDQINNEQDDVFARVFTLSLPHFITKEDTIQLVEEFSDTLINDGMIVSASIHFSNKQNQFHRNHREILLNLINNGTTSNSINKNNDNLTHIYLMCSLNKYMNNDFLKEQLSWENQNKTQEWKNHWSSSVVTKLTQNYHQEKDKVLWLDKIKNLNETYNDKQFLQKPY